MTATRPSLPYTLANASDVLEVWELVSAATTPIELASRPDKQSRSSDKLWQAGVADVPEGQRNATAALLVGRILCRLPESLWETVSWGGLKELDRHNTVPLPERELRSVFLSIVRREHARRQPPQGSAPADDERETVRFLHAA